MATDWEAAVRVENEARGIAERYYIEAARVFDAYDTGAVAYAAVLEREKGYDALTSAHYDTMLAVLKTPAPTIEAVLLKLRMGCSDGFFDGSQATIDVLATIADDVERLSREA